MSENFKMKFRVVFFTRRRQYRVKHQGKYYYFSDKLVKCTKKSLILYFIALASLYAPFLIRLQNDAFRPPELIVIYYFLTVAIVYPVIDWFLYPKNIKDELRLIK